MPFVVNDRLVAGTWQLVTRGYTVLLLFLAPLLTPPAAPDEELPLHIERWCGDLEVPLTPVVMQCGVSCVIDEEGRVTPNEVDWVAPEWAKNGTCRACRAAVGLPAAG